VGVNDPPRARSPDDLAPPSTLPLVPYQWSEESDEGILVRHLIDTFYTDEDAPEEGLGMAVYAASKDSELGRWQLRREEESLWRDLDVADANELLMPEGLLAQQTYRGPLSVRELIRDVACSGGDVQLPPGQCWQEVRIVRDGERHKKRLSIADERGQMPGKGR